MKAHTKSNQCIYTFMTYFKLIIAHACYKQYFHNLPSVVPEGQSKVRGRYMKKKEKCEQF